MIIDNELVDTYAELDSSLGHNVIGAILTVVASHLATGQQFLGDDVLLVDLRRRQDGEPVEVTLSVSRSRKSGRECLSLRWGGEQALET